MNERINAVLEIISDFTKILESKISTAYKSEPIQNSMRKTLSFISSCIQLIISNEKIPNEYNDIFEKISSFLNKIFITRIANECSSSVIKLMTDLLSLKLNPNSFDLSPFIKTTEVFFKMQSFRYEIMKPGNIDTFWNNFINDEFDQNILLPVVIQQMTKHASFYADVKMRKYLVSFLTMINNSIPHLSKTKCEYVSDYLLEISKQGPSIFIDFYCRAGILKSLMPKVFEFSDNEENKILASLIFYADSIPYLIQGLISPALLIIVQIFGDEKSGKKIHEECFKLFLKVVSSIKTAKEIPFQPSEVLIIINSIPSDDYELIKSFIQFITTICQLNFDITPLIPNMMNICSDYNVLTEDDLSPIIDAFNSHNENFSQFSNSFFNPLFQNLNLEQIANLFNKYHGLYNLISTHFSELTEAPIILEKLIGAFPHYKDSKTAKLAIKNVVLLKKGFKHINHIFLGIESAIKIEQNNLESSKNLFSFFVKFAMKNKSFANECITQKVLPKLISFYSTYNFSSILIFNFIAAMADHRYIPSFDINVNLQLKEKNYLNESDQNILDLALGLQNGEDRKKGNLCFPSIVWKCAQYEFKSPFDLYLCFQISFDIWLKETNQPISEFPFITSIARQYLLPKYSKLLLNYPKIIEEICKGEFAEFPLFEFPGTGSDIQLPILFNELNGKKAKNSKDNYPQAVSFWFNFSSFGNLKSECLIANFGSAKLTLLGTNLLFDGNSIGTIKRNMWNLFVITNTDEFREKTVIYLNNENVFTGSNKQITSLIFGGKNSFSNWVIGNGIGIYSAPLKEDQVKIISSTFRIASIESFPISQCVKLYSPYSILPLFKQIDLNSIKGTRPSIVYSFADYIKKAHRGANQLFIKATDLLHENQYDDSRSLLVSICYLHKINCTLWTNKEFALNMSIICNYDTPVVNEYLINLICENFYDSQSNTFDWDNFFKYALDYRFFNSEFEPIISSIIEKYFKAYPFDSDSPLNTIISDFLLLLTIIPDFKQENRKSVFDLIFLFVKDPSRLLRFIISTPDFTNNLCDYYSKYEFKNSETVEILLSLYFSLPLTQFREYYVFNILERKQSLMILDHIINSKLDKFIDDTVVVEFCLTNIPLIQSWEIALDLFLKKDITLKDLNETLDFSTFQIKYFGYFLNMSTFLSFAAIRLNEDNLFFKLCCQALRGLTELVDMIDNPANYLDTILLLMTLGDKITTRSNFPLSPQIETDEEIIKFALSRGQAYPQREPNEFTMPTVEYKLKTTDIPNLTSLLPNEYNLSEKESMPMNFRIKELSFVIMENQFPSSTIDWNSALQFLYSQFDITDTKLDYENSIIVKLIIKFLSRYIIKFPETIETILATNVYLKPELSIFWVKEITFEILREFNENNIFNPDILDYILKRLKEGWYSSIFVEIMKEIIEIVKKNENSNMIPKSFYLCIWTSLDIVVPNNDTISELCKLLVENESMLLNSPTFENIQSILVLIYRGIALVPFLPDFMNNFWLHFVNTVKNNDLFIAKMKKELPNADPNIIIKGLTILGQFGIETFNSFKKSNQAIWHQFDELLQSCWDKQRDLMSDLIKTDVDVFLNQHENNGEIFLKASQKCLNDDLLRRCTSKAIASSVRYYTRRLLILSVEHYLRLREFMISKTFPFKESSSKRYALSILSDPIYPTRRLTLSPIEYNLPSYPNGSSDELYNFVPNEEQKSFENCPMPECIQQVLCYCRIRSPTLLNRFRYPLLARYTAHIDSIPTIEYYLLFSIFGLIPPSNFDSHQNLVSYQQQLVPQNLQGISLNSSSSSILNISEQITNSQMLLTESQLQQQQQLQNSRLSWEQIVSNNTNFTSQKLVANNESVIFVCQTSFLYGIDVLEGTAVFTSDRKMYFFEGANIRSDCFSQCHSHDTLISQEFYVQSFLGGLFSNSAYIFRSHLVVVVDLNQTISVTNHLWIQRPYSMTLNFATGFNFVLIFKKATYDDALSIIKSGMDDFFETAPPPVVNVRSPLASARLILQKQAKSTQMWVDGEIDNFTYLCLVNRLAKRSYPDLTQYPVFPWVISDFQSETINSFSKSNIRDLTKPMGQIGEERAERFDLVFSNADPKYYYGTHYLHFGVVAYFMFRIDPFSIYSFILHHGWDHPNRIFFSIQETWYSAAYETPSDVKELIPQMYKVPEMLLNPSRIPIVTSTNENYELVQLPKWAANARHFMTTNCKAMELKHTTKYIPSWIDLIFGCNSRGPGAYTTKNLFHPTCYPDLTDLEDLDDQLEKQAMITSIINFGQCSPQIFAKPHPHQLEPLTSKVHLLSKINNVVYQPIKCELTPISSIYLYQSDIVFAKKQPSTPHVILPGTTSVIYYHDDPTLSNISISNDGLFICRTYIDGHVMITMLEYSKGSNSPQEIIIENFITELGVKECAISSTHFLALVACGKNILQFDIGTKRKLPTVPLKFAVKHISIDEDAAVIWVTGSQNISLFSISMTPIIELTMTTDITAIRASPLPEHLENRFALIGHIDGTVSFIGFSCQTNKLTSLYRVKLADDPIVSVSIDANGQRAAAATKTACFDFEYIGSKDKPLNLKYACSCSSCAAQSKNLSTCQSCNRFTCPKCLSKEPTTGLKVCSQCKAKMAQKQPQ